MQDIHYLTQLRLEVQQGQQFKYLCFWGHSPKNPQRIDASCLSQWFLASFRVDGIEFSSAEQFMMAKKAELFKDQEIYRKILASSNPGEVKALGRKIQAYDEDIWQQHRFDIVVQGNLAKFSQNQQLKDFLCSTSARVLVEASPVDRIWGIGLAADHQHAQQPQHWQGLNLLGFALMQVRSQLVTHC